MTSELEENKIREKPDDSDNCWICYISYAEDKEKNPYRMSRNGWVAPCKCKGTSMWVHQECLQVWIDEKQNGDTFRAVRCHQCHTAYRYKFPPLGHVATSIQFVENLIDIASPYVCFSVAFFTGGMVLLGYGYFTLIQLVGSNETKQIMDSGEPIIMMVTLPLIPIGLTLFNFVQFEDIIFRYLRRCIPPIIIQIIGPKRYYQIWPQAPRVPTDLATTRRISWWRAAAMGLLLPTIASLVGKVCFYNVENNLKRSLFGGFSYLTLNCIAKLYFKYRYYQNLCHREILNHCEAS